MPMSEGEAKTEATSLEGALRRRFRVAESAIAVGERQVELLHPASADDLISEEDYIRDERLPYWAEPWPSGLVLAATMASALEAPTLSRTRPLFFFANMAGRKAG